MSRYALSSIRWPCVTQSALLMCVARILMRAYQTQVETPLAQQGLAGNVVDGGCRADPKYPFETRHVHKNVTQTCIFDHGLAGCSN
eukprot:4207721-Amphidinium_carterae.1